jgi:hypothetical protein
LLTLANSAADPVPSPRQEHPETLTARPDLTSRMETHFFVLVAPGWRHFGEAPSTTNLSPQGLRTRGMTGHGHIAKIYPLAAAWCGRFSLSRRAQLAWMSKALRRPVRDSTRA